MDESNQQQNLFPPELAEGYERFLNGDFRRERESFHDLAEKGQHPQTLVIGCCDSRVMPEEIFDAAPGEIFDVRNIANLVPPFAGAATHISAWAAVDYAVTVLKVTNIIVLGHGKCGGVRAFIDRNTRTDLASHAHDALAHWIGLIAPAAQSLGEASGMPCEDYAEKLAQESVRRSLENLRGHPGLSQLEMNGALRLHGAFFDVADARLYALEETGDFVQIASERHQKAVAGE